MPKNVTEQAIRTKLASLPFTDGERAVHVALHAGDAAWDPATTRRKIQGPADLRYCERHANGALLNDITTTRREPGTSTITT